MRLDEALKRHRGVGPGFHMLRHLLSFIILAHHCRVAIFHREQEAYNKGAAMSISVFLHLSRAHLAVELSRPFLFALVGMFFALSGFLVAGSAVRSKTIKSFFANRVLRIIPALTVETTLCALVLGPLVTSLPIAHYYENHQFFRYFGNIVGEVTFALPGVFLTNPWYSMVNANLWTLPAEFWCYFVMLALMTTGLLNRHKTLTVIIIAALVVATLLSHAFPARFPVRDGSTHFTPWFIVLMFLFGVLIFTNAKFVSLHPLVFAGALLGYYFLMLFDLLGPVAGLLLAYMTVWIGMKSFALFDKLVKVDVSYGIYLYGFPITQATIYFLFPHMTNVHGALRFAIIFPLVFSLTVLFSLLSWHYIEKPALALRRYFISTGKPSAVIAAELTSPAASELANR